MTKISIIPRTDIHESSQYYKIMSPR